MPWSAAEVSGAKLIGGRAAVVAAAGGWARGYGASLGGMPIPAGGAMEASNPRRRAARRAGRAMGWSKHRRREQGGGVRRDVRMGRTPVAKHYPFIYGHTVT